MDGLMDRCMDGWMDECMEWMHGMGMHGWMKGWMGMDGQMADGWTEGWMDE